MTSVDEVMAFYEENGFHFTEEQKEDVRKISAELAAKAKDGELNYGMAECPVAEAAER